MVQSSGFCLSYHLRSGTRLELYLSWGIQISLLHHTDPGSFTCSQAEFLHLKIN